MVLYNVSDILLIREWRRQELMLQLTNHPHPDPCTAMVAALSRSLRFSKDPKSRLIASINSPGRGENKDKSNSGKISKFLSP